MKASVLSLVFLSGLAAAQIPDCATGCVTKFTTGTSIAGCGQLDIACICKNADFLSGIACCLSSACDKDSQTQAVKYAKQICSSAGVSTPDEVVCNDKSSSTSEPAKESTTATESSESSTTESSESSTTESSESSTTESSESSTTEASESSTATRSGSRTTATTGSSAAAGSQTTTAAATTSSNVAAPLASAGSFVGAAIAMLAAAL